MLNVTEGDALDGIVFGPITRTNLALYAGASGDHNPIHIDLDFAKAAGLNDVFGHGMLSMAQLGRVVSDWAGPDRILSLETQFNAMTQIGDELHCKGVVKEKIERAGANCAIIELTARTQNDVLIVTGEAVVRLS